MFTRDAISLTTGDELRYGVNVNLFSSLRKHFAVWKEIIDRAGVTCKCINNLLRISLLM